MVQAVAGLLLPTSLGSGVSFLGVSLIGANGLTIAGSLVNLGLGAALSNALCPDTPSLPRPSDVQQNFRSEVGSRLVHIGRVKIGGQLVTVREDGQRLFQLIVQGFRQIDGIEELFIDGNQVTLNADGFVEQSQYINGGTPNVQVLTRKGAVPSLRYGEIESSFADWDASAHQFYRDARCWDIHLYLAS